MVEDEDKSKTSADTEVLNAEVDYLKIKIGELFIALDHRSQGVIMVDGKKLKVKRGTVSFEAGTPPKVTLEFYPSLG